MKLLKRTFLIMSILIILGQPSYATDEIGNSQKTEVNTESNRQNVIQNILNLANVLVITADFGFVVGIYFKDKKDKKKDEKSSYKMYWYKKFILENYLVLIENFFNECEKNIKEITENIAGNMTKEEIQKYKVEQFMTFTQSQSAIKQKLTSILSILDEDMSQKVRNIFIKLQEDYTVLLDKMIMSDETNCISRLQECTELLAIRKREILSELYTYGENILEA